MAVAGFKPEELDLMVKDNTLVISGRPANDTPKHEVLYRGIAGRAFERRFVLADHIVVEGAEMTNGLLHAGLKRVVPEALKPRRIEGVHRHTTGDRQRSVGVCQSRLEVARPTVDHDPRGAPPRGVEFCRASARGAQRVRLGAPV